MVDFTSYFPYIAADTVFPTGDFSILMYQQFAEEINCDNNNFIFNDTGLEVHGIALVDILPKQDEHFPCIPYRQFPDSPITFPLCRSCVDQSVVKSCIHEKTNDRCLHSTLSFNELKYARRRGYELIRVIPMLII